MYQNQQIFPNIINTKGNVEFICCFVSSSDYPCYCAELVSSPITRYLALSLQASSALLPSKLVIIRTAIPGANNKTFLERDFA